MYAGTYASDVRALQPLPARQGSAVAGSSARLIAGT
jgi:hypothetical protein